MSSQDKLLIVRASKDRWRAGRKFPAGKDVPLQIADLSEDDLTKLEADPVLSLRYYGEGDDDGGGSETSSSPSDDATRLAAILDAVLTELQPDGFNKDGSPNVGALETVLGWNTSKAEVTSALAAMTDEQRVVLQTRLEAGS